MIRNLSRYGRNNGEEESFAMRKKNEKQYSVRLLGIVILAIILGIGQKMLDTTPVNYLPNFFEKIQFSNHLGQLNAWVVIITVLVVLSKNTKRAAINTFVFLFFMLSSYYLYSYFVLGFLPYYEICKWLLACVTSIPFSIILKYSRNKSTMTFIVNVIIISFLFESALLFLNYHRIKNLLDFIFFIIGVLALYSKSKIYVGSILVSVAISSFYFYFAYY